MIFEHYLSYSFIVFFGGLSAISLLLLYKSIRVSSGKYQLPDNADAIAPWHTPNLKSWKNSFYIILYWIRDISFRYWAVNLLRNMKMMLYRILRTIHKYLLGVIKTLEHQEHSLKSRLNAEAKEPRTPSEEHLIKTLMNKDVPPQNSV